MKQMMNKGNSSASFRFLRNGCRILLLLLFSSFFKSQIFVSSDIPISIKEDQLIFVHAEPIIHYSASEEVPYPTIAVSSSSRKELVRKENPQSLVISERKVIAQIDEELRQKKEVKSDANETTKNKWLHSFCSSSSDFFSSSASTQYQAVVNSNFNNKKHKQFSFADLTDDWKVLFQPLADQTLPLTRERNLGLLLKFGLKIRPPPVKFI